MQHHILSIVCACSEGTCTYEDGAIYSGEWRKGQRAGWGKHIFSNKDWYEGEWEGDTVQGQGRLTFVNGSFYECSWKAGQPIKGTWCSADGQTEYKGQFGGKLQWDGFGILHQTGVRKYMGRSNSHAAFVGARWRQPVQFSCQPCSHPFQ